MFKNNQILYMRFQRTDVYGMSEIAGHDVYRYSIIIVVCDRPH